LKAWTGIIQKNREVSIDDLRVLEIVASLIAQFIKLWESYESIEKEKEHLKRELKGRYSIENVIGDSDRIAEVFKSVYRVAPSKATVLLRGEKRHRERTYRKGCALYEPAEQRPFY